MKDSVSGNGLYLLNVMYLKVLATGVFAAIAGLTLLKGAWAQPETSLGKEPVISRRGIELVSDVDVAEVVSGFKHPWGMTWLPSELAAHENARLAGAILITERGGGLWLVNPEDASTDEVEGVPNIYVDGQGGLLDVVAHPQFASNGWVYFSYSDGSRAANSTHVARARLTGTVLKDWTVLFQVSQLKSKAQHFGSRLSWLPDGTLLVSIGDGGNPPISLDGAFIRLQAQNLNSHLGKILRINDDGTVPADNPWVNNPETQPQLWSYGHRNIQGMTVDAVTGQVWATEHGARGGDELNTIVPRSNYGWPEVSYSREYSNNQPVAPVERRGDVIDPKLVWIPSIAPSGLEIYRGDRMQEWQGDLFAGGLVSRDVRHIEVDGSGVVVRERSIPIGERVRDVKEGPDGFLYVLTDESNGRLLRLQPQLP